jgi:nitrate reductase cytochrome c-type subunit
MVSKMTKSLLVTLFIIVLAVSFFSCTTAGKRAATDKPSQESTLLPRAFEGAPPLIPHDVEGEDMACLDCHRLGDNDAVITSHPERVNCRQCHIPQNMDVKPFVENTF